MTSEIRCLELQDPISFSIRLLKTSIALWTHTFTPIIVVEVFNIHVSKSTNYFVKYILNDKWNSTREIPNCFIYLKYKWNIARWHSDNIIMCMYSLSLFFMNYYISQPYLLLYLGWQRHYHRSISVLCLAVFYVFHSFFSWNLC